MRGERKSKRRKGRTRVEKRERSSDREMRERSNDSGVGERGSTNDDNPHSVDAELKLNLPHSKLGDISPEPSLVKKVVSREDLQKFEKDFSNVKSSPRLSRKKSSHIIRELREAMTDTKDYVESSAPTRRGRLAESLQVPSETNSLFENSPNTSLMSESLNPSSPSPEPFLTNTSSLKQILMALGDPE